jgi:RimJ/RimL family protein N-acetyltransferase
MRTSFHHQPEAQHPNFQLSTSWQADYPIFRAVTGRPSRQLPRLGCARSRHHPWWLGVALSGPRQCTEPSWSLLSDYCMRQVRRMDDSFEQPFPRPLSGRLVPTPNCLVPSRSPLVGRYVRWEPLNPTIHAAELYQAGHGSDEALRIWEYLPFGPWPDEVAFLAWLRDQAATFDHIWFALRPHKSEQAEGMASYLDIHPLDGVIEIGGIWFGTELQRTRPATEALFLLLSYAMDDLGYRRMQWRCNSLNVKYATQPAGWAFVSRVYSTIIWCRRAGIATLHGIRYWTTNGQRFGRSSRLGYPTTISTLLVMRGARCPN